MVYKGYFVIRDSLNRSCTMNVSVKIEINSCAAFALTGNSLPSVHFQAQQVFHKNKWCGSHLLCQDFKKNI